MEGTTKPQFWGIITSAPAIALSLAMTILVASGGLSLLLFWQNYNSSIRAGEAMAEASAHVVATNMEWMIEASVQALQRIDSALGDQPIRRSAEKVADISQAVGQLPEGFQYSVYDEAGHLHLSSEPHAVDITVADREYFLQMKAGQDMVVSPQLQERLTKRSVFVVAHRITRNGLFHGAATIAIPATRMDEFWNAIGLGGRSTVSLLRDDGWLVARHPALPEAINLASVSLFTEYLPKSPSGVYHVPKSPIDGLARVVGYRKIEGWPLVATASIEESEILHQYWSSLKIQMLIALPVMGLLLASVLWIVWLMRAYAARNLALEVALDRNHFLFREIHHRVKNNLQAVSSLIRLQPMPADIRQDITRRIAAMVAVHEHIYQSDQFDRVDIAPYVERLVRDIAASHSANIEIRTSLDALEVDRDAAMPIGMIVNEVIANAFKYAFIGRDHGLLTVELTRSESDQGRLIIRDDGPGLPEGEQKKGMGSKLITGFVAQIAGTYTLVTDHGTVFTLDFPLNPFAASS